MSRELSKIIENYQKLFTKFRFLSYFSPHLTDVLALLDCCYISCPISYLFITVSLAWGGLVSFQFFLFITILSSLLIHIIVCYFVMASLSSSSLECKLSNLLLFLGKWRLCTKKKKKNDIQKSKVEKKAERKN
jgi:hypothetical protein